MLSEYDHVDDDDGEGLLAVEMQDLSNDNSTTNTIASVRPVVVTTTTTTTTTTKRAKRNLLRVPSNENEDELDDEELSEASLEERERKRRVEAARKKHTITRHVLYNFSLTSCIWVPPGEPLQRRERLFLYSFFVVSALMVTLIGSTPEKELHGHGETGGTLEEVYKWSDAAQFWLTLAVSWPGMHLSTFLLNWSLSPQFKHLRTRVAVRYMLALAFVVCFALTLWKIATLPLAAIQRGFKIWLETWVSEQLIEVCFHVFSYLLCVHCCCQCCTHCHYCFWETLCPCFLYSMNKELYLTIDDHQRRVQDEAAKIEEDIDYVDGHLGQIDYADYGGGGDDRPLTVEIVSD
jgi:hypothetical protein